MEKETELADLPLELLFIILSRLPVICLVKTVKYTCKLWYSIINNPSFSELHLTHCLNNNPPGHLYALAPTDSSLYFADDPTLALKLPGDLGDANKYTSFTSCRGLILYRSIQEQAFYICNPITGDQVKVPTPVFRHGDWGFGHAPLTNRYKYVQFSLQNQPNVGFTLHGAIYTLGDEIWREIAVPNQIFPWGRTAVYCNGSLYWIMSHLTQELEYQVVSIDLDTEEVRLRRVLPLGTKADCPLYLTISGGSVAFVTKNLNSAWEVWMLMDEAENVWVQNYDFCSPTTTVDDIRIKCTSYNAYSCKLPLAVDMHLDEDVNEISPRRVIPHVGSLSSPSRTSWK